MSSPLQDKSKAFALQIIKVCNTIKAAKKESVLTNQLIRSGTVSAQISAKRFMRTEKPILSQNCKLH